MCFYMHMCVRVCACVCVCMYVCVHVYVCAHALFTQVNCHLVIPIANTSHPYLE